MKPVKGFRDFLPKDWKIQEYIFETWRKVCLSYGFDEYNGPVLEFSSIYNKSGDDVGTSGKELYRFEDKRGRDLALRPEMTPTVGRMVAEYGSALPKPIRWFSIAQFFRAEKPQRGRGREFFQLNADIFGSESIYSDFEIIRLAVDIMLAFGANEEMFKVKINNRRFTDYFTQKVLGLDKEESSSFMKVVDASPKNNRDWFEKSISEINPTPEFLALVDEYLRIDIADLEKYVEDSEGAREAKRLFKMLKDANLSQYCELDTSMARGFDYYTGMVFEVFDMNPNNNRSMFGGGRYDDLLDIFDKPKVPAVGFAPGDITTKLFLESWGLLPDNLSQQNADIYIPMIEEKSFNIMQSVADKFRKEGRKVEVGVDVQAIGKAMSYANKAGFSEVIIIGEEELKSNSYSRKDMKSGEQITEELGGDTL